MEDPAGFRCESDNQTCTQQGFTVSPGLISWFPLEKGRIPALHQPYGR
jgi:hypothetical protein